MTYWRWTISLNTVGARESTGAECPLSPPRPPRHWLWGGLRARRGHWKVQPLEPEVHVTSTRSDFSCHSRTEIPRLLYRPPSVTTSRHGSPRPEATWLKPSPLWLGVPELLNGLHKHVRPKQASVPSLPVVVEVTEGRLNLGQQHHGLLPRMGGGQAFSHLHFLLLLPYFPFAAICLSLKVGRFTGDNPPDGFPAFSIFRLDFSGGPVICSRLINNFISKSSQIHLCSVRRAKTLAWLPWGLQTLHPALSLLPGPQSLSPCFHPLLTVSPPQWTVVLGDILGVFSVGLQLCSREGYSL